MITAFGAPIGPTDTKIIVDYLWRTTAPATEDCDAQALLSRIGQPFSGRADRIDASSSVILRGFGMPQHNVPTG
jgi:hypothetical protein